MPWLMGSHNSGSKNNDNINLNLSNRYDCQVILDDIFSSTNDIETLTYACGNGNNTHIYRCKNNKCKFKFDFFPTDKILSTVTKRLFDCVIPPGTIYLDCHSPNVIYLLTCNRCHLQYVGETAQKLNERFNFHKTGFRHPTKHGHCRILSTHFNEGLCKGATYKVQILEKLQGNGRTARGALDPSITQFRKSKETEWIRRLRTAYPYGLNDKIGEYTSRSDNSFIATKFPSLNRNYSRIRGIKHVKSNVLSGKEFLHKLNRYLLYHIPNTMNFIRTSVASLNKKSLKDIANVMNDEILRLPSHFKYLQWYFATIDAIKSKMYQPKIQKTPKKSPENICKIYFCNKAVELINMPRIFNLDSVRSVLISSNINFPTPTVIYNLSSPIYHKVFNFRSFLSEIEIEEVVNDLNSLPCDCQNSPFKDSHHGHIITGDLRIVSNNKLRKILCKGPKFRENTHVDFNKAKKDITNGIDNCIASWCKKKDLPEEAFLEWRNIVINEIDIRIEELNTNFTLIRQSKTSLKNNDVKQSLSELHDKFILTPIDKATNNIAIICKRFYILTLLKELGLQNDSDGVTNTYELCADIEESDLFNNHSNFLKKLNLKITEDNKRLPNIYWLPKLHKKPTKARFIIAAPKCSIKPLSKSITSVFKLLFNQIHSYNDESRYYSGVNSFWTILNNKPVINSINNLNKRSKASSISCFDFSTLYTNIPHDKLIKVMRELIEFCFKGGNKRIIKVDRYGASWVTEEKSSSVYFSKNRLKDAVRYLLNHCYFRFGNKIFRQKIGIPMGSDPAPFFANLFLYFYENRWIRQLKKQDIQKARRFSNIFRFIDDLVAINDNNEFENCFKEIYPSELELKKENIGYTSGSFLDLMITIEDQKFTTKLYDKRDDFPFAIVRMPYVDSNIPSKIFYSSFGAEILRYARNTNEVKIFLDSCHILIARMLKQGGRVEKLLNVLNKMFGRHFDTFSKFCQDSLALKNLMIHSK